MVLDFPDTFNPNDPNNLNPQFGQTSQPVKEETPTEKRKEKIEQYNKSPEFTKSKIKIVDLDENKPLGKNWYRLLIIMACLGFICISGAFLVGAYIIYNDGSLKPIVTSICQPVINFSVPDMTCPDVVQSCSDNVCKVNLSCPTPHIKVYLNAT